MAESDIAFYSSVDTWGDDHNEGERYYFRRPSDSRDSIQALGLGILGFPLGAAGRDTHTAKKQARPGFRVLRIGYEGFWFTVYGLRFTNPTSLLAACPVMGDQLERRDGRRR